MWFEPTATDDQHDEKTFWYEKPNALEDIEAMDASKRDWNFSPLSYDFAIHGGRGLNVAFVLGTFLAAPTSIAVSPTVALICVGLATAMQTRNYLKRKKAGKKAMQNITPAPDAVKALTKNVYNRAGLPGLIGETLNVSIIEPDWTIKDAFMKQLPYTIAIDPKENHVLIGRKSLEELDRDELQAILAHECSHRMNRHFFTCAQSVTEKNSVNFFDIDGCCVFTEFEFPRGWILCWCRSCLYDRAGLLEKAR